MKAHEKMEKRIKEEVAALKEKQKEQMAQLYSFDRALPEVEHLIEPVEVHDLEDHVVTISSMDTVAMASKVRYGVTRNELQEKDEESGAEEEQEAEDEQEAEEASPSQDIDLQIKGDSVKSVKKALTKQVVKSVKKLKVFQKKMKLENSKNAKKSRSRSRRQENSKKKLGKRRNRPNSRRPPQR